MHGGGGIRLGDVRMIAFNRCAFTVSSGPLRSSSMECSVIVFDVSPRGKDDRKTVLLLDNPKNDRPTPCR